MRSISSKYTIYCTMYLYLSIKNYLFINILDNNLPYTLITCLMCFSLKIPELLFYEIINFLLFFINS